MKSSNLSFVPLNHASLCLDCEMITAEAKACAACGSSALMNVARTLGQPRHTRRFRAPSAAAANVSYNSNTERQAFMGQQNRLMSQTVCLQGE